MQLLSFIPSYRSTLPPTIIVMIVPMTMFDKNGQLILLPFISSPPTHYTNTNSPLSDPRTSTETIQQSVKNLVCE